MPVRIPILAILTLALLPTAHAADLWQVWQLARSNDPAFRQAEATRRVSMQDRPAAWARLFPSISLNASRTWNNTSSSALRFFGGSQVVPVNSTSNDRQDQWGAQLTQPLFNWQLFQALRGADLSVAQAEARYHATIQGLIVTTAQAYFNVLNAQDNLNADRADARALAKQYEQVTQQYKVGLASITGVRQAEAGYDQARARVIGSRQALARAEEALRASEERYALASAGANEGIWDWDIAKNEAYLSPRLMMILGFGATELRTTPQDWHKRLHPDDRAPYIARDQPELFVTENVVD